MDLKMFSDRDYVDNKMSVRVKVRILAQFGLMLMVLQASPRSANVIDFL